MGPKHFYFNSFQIAKEGESYFSMKNIPESMENSLYPTQNDNLIKNERTLHINLCQVTNEDVYKLTKEDNSIQLTEDVLHQKQNQYDTNGIEINEEKLYPSCIEDDKIKNNDEQNKKFVTKSSISTCQHCCTRKKQSSDFSSNNALKQYLSLNKFDVKSRFSNLNIPNMSQVFKKSVYCQEIASDNSNSPKKEGRTNQQNVKQMNRRKEINLRKSWLHILYYVGKMKRIMCQTILFFRPHMLSSWQLQIINDQSSDFTLQQSSIQSSTRKQKYKSLIKRYNTNFMKQVMRGILLKANSLRQFKIKVSNILQNCINIIPLFDSMSISFQIWEVIIFIITTINFIMIPLELCLEDVQSGIYRQFKCIYVILLTIDIFIRANTIITYEENQEKDFHLKLITKYLSGDFILDVICILSLFYFFLPYQYLILLFFIKIFNFSNIINKIQEKFMLSNSYISGIISFTILLLKALYFCHVFSCGFLELGLYQIQNDSGWLIHYQLHNSNRWTQYLYSYYFSVITMTTIGYGDITAQTEIERFFMIFFTIISCGIFGYTINSIGNILYDFNKKNEHFLQQLAQLNKYFKFFKVDASLQNKARKYLEFINSEKFSNNYVSTDSSLSSLSSYLQNEIKLNTCKKVIDKFQVLTQLFSEQFRYSLSAKMKELELAPEQFIFQQGQCIEPAIYFINCGLIEVVNEKCNTSHKQVIQSLKHGDIFGIENFFGEINEKCFSYKSKESSSLFYLTQSDFQQELKKFPDQVETYCYLRDSIQFNNDYSKISKPCFSCKRFTHSLDKCPYLFYGTNKQRIIQNFNKNIDQVIKNFNRKSFKKVNSLSVQKYVNLKVDEFLDCNQRYQMIQSKIQFSDLDLDQQEDGTFFDNCSQIGYRDIQFNNQIIVDESIEPSSILQKVPSQQYQHLLSIKEQQKNNNQKSYESFKNENDNFANILTPKSLGKINTKEQQDNFLFHNSQNLIKTIDLDSELVKQMKSASLIQNDQNNTLEKPQTLYQSQFSRQKSQQIEMHNSQNSQNTYFNNQQNMASSSVMLKLPLGKSNANQKSQKEKPNNIEQVISISNIPISKTQIFKSQSIQDQGSLGLIYNMTQQNYKELKDMMYSIMNQFQHHEFAGSLKKQKKIFESKNKTIWMVTPQQLGDLDLDSLHNYKTYFPKYNIENVIQKMKIKLALNNLKNKQNSLSNSLLIKNSLKELSKGIYLSKQ